jgi:hypothetical protein
MNYKHKLYIYILIIFVLATLFYYIYFNNYKYKYYNYDSFEMPQTTRELMPENFERTKLYGSLFLDGLNKVIKNMTDPPITYDTKRIELIKYSDILL